MKNVEFLLKKGFDLKGMNINYDGVHGGYTIYCGGHIVGYERYNDDDIRIKDIRIKALLRWMDEEHKINILDDTHPCRFCKNCDHAVPGDDLGCYWCDAYGEVWGHNGKDCPRFTNVDK